MGEAPQPAKKADDLLDALAQLPGEPPLAVVTGLLGRLAPRLRGKSPLEVEAAREQAIRALTGKVSAPARLIDAALAGGAAGKGRPLQGQEVVLEAPEPWPAAVDGALLLDELAAVFTRYLALPEGAAPALALWVLHAHAHDAAQVSPLLVLASPEKRCGKTTALTLVGALVPKPLPASNITSAALFRAVERFSPTLLVDEADSFLGEREELRGVLNSGHTRALAYVVRTVGEEHEPRKFSTWGPKAVALIGRMPSTLEDRSVVIPMRRKAPGERVEALRLDRLGEVEGLRRKAARWAADTCRRLAEADPEIPEGLHDRAADNWRPLLAIADAAGGAWPERARQAARVLCGGTGAEDASIRVELLADLREVFRRGGEERLFTDDLLSALHDEERPWSEWGRSRRPLSAPALARLLKPFGVKPRKIRIGEEARQGYLLEFLEDPFRRYLPAEPEQPEQANNHGGLEDVATRNGGGDVPGSEGAANAQRAGLVPGVPGRRAEWERV